MERSYFLFNFARRLTALLQQAGFSSSRSKAGVKINKLAEVSGCTQQMARRYVLGEALPEIDVTFKIAKWLKVSPGWLLYGEDSEIPNNFTQPKLIHIEPGLLRYILVKSAPLFSVMEDVDELISFIMDIINDATHVEAEKKAIVKLIDVSINSAVRFKGRTHDQRNKN